MPDDPRFGDIAILFNPRDPSQRLMRKTKKSETPEEFANSKVQAEEREKICQENILRLADIEFDEENMITSVYFEYPDDTVTIEELGVPKTIEMFRDVMKAVAYLQERKMVHGDLRPAYIAYSNPDRCYKLLDRLADISPPMQCQLNNINNYKALYMAPKIFDGLLKKSKKIRQNSYKSEVFSLGFVCLGAFESPEFLQEYYDFDDERFAAEDFNQKLENICKRNYDQITIEFVKMLAKKILVIDEKARLTPSEVLDAMKANASFAYLFDPDEIEDAKKRRPVEPQVNYYNPFDFLKTEDLIKQNKDIISIDGSKTMSTGMESIPAELRHIPKESPKDHVPHPGDHKKYERHGNTEIEEYAREHVQPHPVENKEAFLQKGIITNKAVAINETTKVDLEAKTRHMLEVTGNQVTTQQQGNDGEDDDDQDGDMNAFMMGMDRPDTVDISHKNIQVPKTSNVMHEKMDTVQSEEEGDSHKYHAFDQSDITKFNEVKNYSFKGVDIEDVHGDLLNKSESDDQSEGDIGEQFKELGIEVRPEEREDSTLEKVIQRQKTSEIYIYDEKIIKMSVPIEKKSQVKFSDFLKQNTSSKRDLDATKSFFHSKIDERAMILESIASPKNELKGVKETAISGTFSFINPKRKETNQLSAEKTSSNRKLPNFGIINNYSVMNYKNDAEVMMSTDGLARAEPFQGKTIRYSNTASERTSSTIQQRSKSQFTGDKGNLGMKGISADLYDEKYAIYNREAIVNNTTDSSSTHRNDSAVGGDTQRGSQTPNPSDPTPRQGGEEYRRREINDQQSLAVESQRFKQAESDRRLSEEENWRRQIDEDSKIREKEMQERMIASETRHKQLEEENKRRQQEIESAWLQEEERKKKLLVEEQRQLKELERLQLIEEENKRIQQEEDTKRRKLEAEKERLMEEENRNRQLEEEIRRRAAEAELKRKELEEKAEKERKDEEALRKKLEDDDKRRKQEEEALMKAIEEENRKKAEEEAELKRLEEEAHKKRVEEEMHKRKMDEEAQRRKINEELKRQQLEEEEIHQQKLEAEAARKRQEAELLRKKEDEQSSRLKIEEVLAQQQRLESRRLEEENEMRRAKAEEENRKRLQKIKDLEEEKRRIQAKEMDKQRLWEIERAAEDKIRETASLKRDTVDRSFNNNPNSGNQDITVTGPGKYISQNNTVTQQIGRARGQSGVFTTESYNTTTNLDMSKDSMKRIIPGQQFVNQTSDGLYRQQDTAPKIYGQMTKPLEIPSNYTQKQVYPQRYESQRGLERDLNQSSNPGYVNRILPNQYGSQRGDTVYSQPRTILPQQSQQVYQPQSNVSNVYHGVEKEGTPSKGVSVKHVDYYTVKEMEKNVNNRVVIKKQTEVDPNYFAETDIGSQKSVEQLSYRQSPVANIQLYNERAFETSIGYNQSRSTKWVNSLNANGNPEPISQYTSQPTVQKERKIVRCIGPDGREFFRYE